VIYKGVGNLLFGIGGEDPVKIGHFAVGKGLVNDVGGVLNGVESGNVGGPKDGLEGGGYLRHGWEYYILKDEEWR